MRNLGALVLLISLTLFASCSDEEDNSPLVGSWTNTSTQQEIEFNPDGTGIFVYPKENLDGDFGSVNFNYYVDEGEQTVYIQDPSQSGKLDSFYDYTVSSVFLILNNPDSGHILEFTSY